MRTWSNEEIADKLDNEELGYMITDYISAENIEDKHLAEKWKQCSDLLDEIEKYLEKFRNEEE